ncbi:MAG TPA: hypothetical protein ENN87_14020 [Phycisphaerales bacterium]|nr:hypothetical protein [Phycisphaerales bacterium]
MRIKWLLEIGILASAGAAFALPSLVTDTVPINTLLVADPPPPLGLGSGIDNVGWTHVNPFVDHGIGNYDLTLANGGILGVDLVVTADFILWDGDLNNLDNDVASVFFEDKNGDTLTIPFLSSGVNSLSIDPAVLGLLHESTAQIIWTPGNDLSDLSPDDAYIYSSALTVRYDTDLVVAGAGAQPIPAPGTLVLASLGCSLVGYLRRRRAF